MNFVCKTGFIISACLFILSDFTVSCTHAEEGNFSDNFVSYRYGVKFREPSVAGGKDIQKNIFNFTHFNTDRLGSNFLSIDTLFSHANDPAKKSNDGAWEVYSIYRRDWSLSKLATRNVAIPGIVRDIAWHMGGDVNFKNTLFAPNKRLIVMGPQLQFAVPKGYFNVAFDISQEWNYNGIARRHVTFEPAFELEAIWGIPFKIYKTDWKLTGFFNYIAPKGRDGFGVETKGEILSRPELLLDIGKIMGTKKSIELGFAYEYWLNKFGNNHHKVAGSFAKTPMLIFKMHF